MNAKQMLQMGGFPDTDEGRKDFYNTYPTPEDWEKKHGGQLSGAPHNGQPTANEFFNWGHNVIGPQGFYMDGGTHLPEAFPQQPPANYFFSEAPWSSDLGSLAYGGPTDPPQGIPYLTDVDQYMQADARMQNNPFNGFMGFIRAKGNENPLAKQFIEDLNAKTALSKRNKKDAYFNDETDRQIQYNHWLQVNQENPNFGPGYKLGGQPCYECGGGYMEIGGTNQYGGMQDGSIDYFDLGGDKKKKGKKPVEPKPSHFNMIFNPGEPYADTLQIPDSLLAMNMMGLDDFLKRRTNADGTPVFDEKQIGMMKKWELNKLSDAQYYQDPNHPSYPKGPLGDWYNKVANDPNRTKNYHNRNMEIQEFPEHQQGGLVKAFRDLAKKAYGGSYEAGGSTVNGTDQEGYINEIKNDFMNATRNYFGGVAGEQAYEQAMNGMRQGGAMMPYANNGYNVGPYGNQGYNNFDDQGNEYNTGNMFNTYMAQNQLDNLRSANRPGSNLKALSNALTTGYFNANSGNGDVNWNLEYRGDTPRVVAYGGDLPQAQWGKNFGPDPGNLFNKGIPFKPAPQSGTDPNAGLNDAQILRKKIEAQYPIRGGVKKENSRRVINEYRPGSAPNGYYEQNPGYQTSQNGQTNYDYNYGSANSWDNVNQNPNGGGNWTTQGFNAPLPFYNQMFNNPDYTTRMSKFKTKNNIFGNKVKMKFNTYNNDSNPNVDPSRRDIRKANREAKNNTKNVNINADPGAARNVGTSVNQPVTTTPNTDIVNYFGQGAIPQSEPSKKTLSPFLQAQLKAGQTMPPTGAQKKELFMSNKFANDQNAQNALFQTEPAPFYNNNNVSPFAPTANFGYGGYYSLPMAQWGKNLGPAWGTPQGGDPNRSANFNRADRASFANPANPANPADPSGRFTLTGKQNTWSGGDYANLIGVGLAGATNIANKANQNNLEGYIANSQTADMMYAPREGYRGGNQELGMGEGTDYNPTQVNGYYTKRGGAIYDEGGAYEDELTEEQIQHLRDQGYDVQYT